MSAQSRRRGGQAAAEYALLLGVITAAMVGMLLYAKRGIQAGVKSAADRLASGAAEQSQQAGMQYESGDRTNKAVAEGAVLERRSATQTGTRKGQQYDIGAAGSVTKEILEDQTDSRGALDARGTSASASVVINVR